MGRQTATVEDLVTYKYVAKLGFFIFLANKSLPLFVFISHRSNIAP